MYQPRRISDVAPATELDDAAAFRTAPRRAARSRADVMRTRVAPTAVSVALLATSGGFALNLKLNESTQPAVPAPVRDADDTSRSVARDVVTTEADEVPVDAPPAKGYSTEEAVTVEAFVGGSWAASFGASAGTKYAQGDLVVRAQPTSGAEELGSVKKAEKVAVTDKVVEGYRQIAFNGKVGYILNNKLGDKAPVEATPMSKEKGKAAPKGDSGNKSDGKSGGGGGGEKYDGPTDYNGKGVLGLKPKAMVVYNAVTARWSFKAIGGYRPNSRSNHQRGGAIDFMTYTDSSKGWAVANFLVANAKEFDIDHIIFEQKIWTPYRPYWRHMADRGSITQNHYDHVHVSVKL